MRISSHPGRRAVALAAVGLVALASCSSGPSYPRLVQPGDSHPVSVGVVNVGAGEPASFGGMFVCLDRPGTVRVRSVQLVNPQHGLVVQRWALRPWPKWDRPLGGALSTLAEAGFHGGTTVDVVCGYQTGRGFELGVELARPSTEAATTTGLRVIYLSGGHRGSLVIQHEFQLCTGSSERACPQDLDESGTP